MIEWSNDVLIAEKLSELLPQWLFIIIIIIIIIKNVKIIVA